MSKATLEKKICIEPKYLNDNLFENIKNILNEKYMDKCDQQYGYIIKIYDSIQILDNIISTTSSGVYFYIKFTVKYVKPELNTEAEGKVCIIFSSGVFVEFNNKIKVLIPKDKMGKYVYDKNKNCFKYGNNTISVGDSVGFIIDMIKYEKHNFNCIGSLKN